MDNITQTPGNDTVSEVASQYNSSLAKQEPDSGKSLPFEEGKRYTYNDMLSWGGEIEPRVQYELIDGIPAVMQAPAWQHQKISVAISTQLYNFLEDKPCRVFHAAFDVRFNADGADDTVLQPDVLVICDKSVPNSNHAQITGTGCIGTPDMIIEILSPGTAQRDRLMKFQVYEKYGVREYWIIEPDDKALTVYTLENGRYYVKKYSNPDAVAVHILEGCVIEFSKIFQEIAGQARNDEVKTD